MFGDHVVLGGLAGIVIIVATLIAAEASFQAMFNLLGRGSAHVDSES